MKLEFKKYYIPIYCSRHFPSLHDIYNYIIEGLVNLELEVFEDYDLALKVAQSYLCDDDCCAVATLDFTTGIGHIYYEKKPEYKGYVCGLPSNLDIYKIRTLGE